MNGVQVVGPLDRCFGWDGARLYRDDDFPPGATLPARFHGAAASASADGAGLWRLVRDSLGINKLFWGHIEDGTVVVGARPRRVIDAGVEFERISAFPCGAAVDIGPKASAPVQQSFPTGLPSDSPLGRQGGLASVARAIRARLDGYLEALASAHGSTRVYVCLSGGLDSSVITALAREHFRDVVAVSFDIVGGRPHGPSDDRQVAKRLARDLDMPLLEATVRREALLEPLDIVLVEGIDWRDFNVHAGLVNAVLARTVKEATSSGCDPPLVLTGDLANEFLVDYHAESYRGQTYYALPSLAPEALRSTLVKGLDTSHREVGVFAAWNLAVVQPYAAAVDEFLALPEDFLTLPDRKQQLSRAVLPGLPEYIYSRPKVRAQIGSAQGGGVLAACVDRGVDAAYLRRRFAQLHGAGEASALDKFIRAGRYRAAIPRLGS